MSWFASASRWRRMGPAEIACRSRQKVLQLGDRLWRDLGAEPGSLGALRELRRSARENEESDLLSRFDELGPKRFFTGAASPIPSGTEAANRIVAAADKIRSGRFDLLGNVDLGFGDPIDWHYDPVSSRRAPRAHWSRIDPLDYESVGDSKVIWELNRHQWMVTLGQAFRLTGDEVYARELASRFRSWRQSNPAGTGLPWASSLEVALRLISWCWCLHLLRGSKALDAALFHDVVASIALHARHVESYLSYYFSPNTHLTGEALGLFYAGVALPDLRSASRWRALGAHVLVEELDRQVLDDGVYFEQSTCYQRYTLDFYLHFLLLSERNALPVPAGLRERLGRMLDVLLSLRRPDGTLPAIGDSDGGVLLPLFPRAPEDAGGLFAVAAAVLDRSDFAWAADPKAPEVEWLLGEEGRRAFDAIEPAAPRGASSRVFPDGGYVVLRDSYAEDAHHAIFDVGPLGCPWSSGHGHADLLSLQLSAFGEPYLVDPGTFGYTPDVDFRNHLRGTGAHSTLRIDGRDQADPRGPFAWTDRPSARLRLFLSADGLVVAEGEHHAYCSSIPGAVHRRRVLLVKDAYWIVVDDVGGSGGGVHEIEVRFQFAPLEVSLEADGWARAVGRRGSALLLKSFATAPLTAQIRKGRLSPKEGWFSPDYGRVEPAPVVRVAARTPLPARIVTLLHPLADPSAPVPGVEPVFDERNWPVALAFAHGEIVRFHGPLTTRPEVASHDA